MWLDTASTRNRSTHHTHQGEHRKELWQMSSTCTDNPTVTTPTPSTVFVREGWACQRALC